MYVIKYGRFQTVLRITYTGIHNDPPLVDFEFEDRNYDVGEKVVFDGSQTFDTEGDALTFNWFFGDGATSSETGPSHAYATPGEYKVALIVVDALNQGQKPGFFGGPDRTKSPANRTIRAVLPAAPGPVNPAPAR